MIITRLQGGLGNQLFQYCAARALSLIMNDELTLDISGMEKPLDGHLSRNYMLDYFNVEAEVTDENILLEYKNNSFWEKLFFKPKTYFKQLVFDETEPAAEQFRNIKYFIKPNTYEFFPDVLLKRKGDIYLDGYWQSFKYFNTFDNIITEDLQLKLKLKDKNTSLLDTIKDTNSISIHIRRSDYLTTEFGNKYFITLSVNYYKEAIAYLLQKFDDLKFFIFSDDIEWCKENLGFINKINFISDNSPVEDLYLMSHCKHNIISNSTFSWWGACLNKNPKKIIITPAQWYKVVNTSDMCDLLPESWIKI